MALAFSRSRAPATLLTSGAAMSFSVHNFAQSPGLKHCRAFVNGINMHYVLAGASAAPPVVLIHGWPETWFAWRKQIPVLSQKFRLIVPDLRGYGKRKHSLIIHAVLYAVM
jgi:hypothetical protein